MKTRKSKTANSVTPPFDLYFNNCLAYLTKARLPSQFLTASCLLEPATMEIEYIRDWIEYVFWIGLNIYFSIELNICFGIELNINFSIGLNKF